MRKCKPVDSELRRKSKRSGAEAIYPGSEDWVDVKEFIIRQHALDPFRTGWPLDKSLAPELESLGFASIVREQIEPHPVYMYRGRIGSSGCTSADSIRKIVKKIARDLAFSIPIADIHATASRGRFQVVLHIPA